MPSDSAPQQIPDDWRVYASDVINNLQLIDLKEVVGMKVTDKDCWIRLRCGSLIPVRSSHNAILEDFIAWQKSRRTWWQKLLGITVS